VTLDVSTIVASRLFRLAAGILVAIVTARMLGPAGRGEYFLVVTLAGVVAQLGNLGLHSSNTYQVARDHQLLRSLVANSLWASILVGGVLSAAVVAGSYLLDLFGGPANRTLWFVVLLAPLGLFFLLGQNLLLGLRRAVLFSAIEILSSALLVTLLIVAALLLPIAGGFLAARSVAILISSAVLLSVLVRGTALRLRFDASTFRAGLGYSVRAYLVALLAYLVLRTNVFLLQIHSGFEEVGLYSVATQVADALEILPTSVALVLFPRLLHEADEGWHMMTKALARVALMMVGVCFAIWIGSDALFALAFGPDFDRSSLMLRLLLPQVFLISVTTIVSQFLAAKGIPLSLIGVWALGLVIALLLGSLLIPVHRGEGAAVALSLTYLLVFGLATALAFVHRGQQGRSQASG
jgi:antigen flippase